MILTDWTT